MMTNEKLTEMLAEQKRLENTCVEEGVARFHRRLEAARERSMETDSKEGEATVGAALKMLREGTAALGDAIKEMCEGPDKRTHRHVAVRWCKLAGYDVAAYLTMKVVLNGINKERQARSVADLISELLVDELRYRRFQEKCPGFFEYKLHNFKTTSYIHMARSMDAALSKATYKDDSGIEHYVDVSDLEMTPDERYQVGLRLLDLAHTVTFSFTGPNGMFNLVDEVTGAGEACRDQKLVVATEETLKWLSERNEALETLFPVNLPMVVPPLKWGPGVRGGYRYALRGKHGTTRGNSKEWRQVVDNNPEMPVVFNALNRIQETPWKINRRLLVTIQSLLEAGGGRAGLPLVSDLKPEVVHPKTPEVEAAFELVEPWKLAHPRPSNEAVHKNPELAREWEASKPADILVAEKAIRTWKKKVGEIHDSNWMRRKKMVDVRRVLMVAEMMANYEAIWFPHNLDFRGRIYPLTSYLHPQGDDLMKSLLTFAQGKPLGEYGAGWLALHGANAMGSHGGRKLSKLTLDERAAWVVENTEAICAAAEDPISNDWWMQADEPLVFLAFCFEWWEFTLMDRQGMGHEFISCLPVAMDGTCNGLQHYAALLRDETTARSVNVLPNERPEDIYQRVADAVLVTLEELAGCSDPLVWWKRKEKEWAAKKKPKMVKGKKAPSREKDFDPDTMKDDRLVYLKDTCNLAAWWLKSGLVNRKLTKRNVMTFPYGSKQYGFKDQLMGFLKELANYKSIEDELGTVEVEVEDKKTKVKQKKQVKRTSWACALMAKLIWEALGETVVAARLGMDWLQECARRIAAGGKMVEWTVPATGFKVRQEYVEENKRQVETTLAGKRFRVTVYDKTTTPDMGKQASAIAPNVIHSLDAAALMLTVVMASEQGLEFFGMIHDSYATLAGDAAALADTLRRAFFVLYAEHDVVGQLMNQFIKLVEHNPELLNDFPAPPPMGSLDLAVVIQSNFFFC